MSAKFPTFPVGTIFTRFEAISHLTGQPRKCCNSVKIKYPLRLNGMSIDASAIALENATSFPAGEVFFSIDRFVDASLTITEGGGIHIAHGVKRKSLINHACHLMSAALDTELNLDIDLHCDAPIHSGFGSSGAIIGAVCSGINELYGNQINRLDLLEYITKNYGEETENDDHLQLVQCIGGSVACGLVNGGVGVVAGNAVPIIAEKINAKVLIAVPKDFVPKTAREMMELEERNIDNFESHGQKYSYEIAYNLLHRGLPALKRGEISEICKIIFRHRFEMGSIKNCSFVHPRVNKIAEHIRLLYDEGHCKLVSMSSVGPAFFVIENDDHEDTELCKKVLSEEDMTIFEANIWNNSYTKRKE